MDISLSLSAEAKGYLHTAAPYIPHILECVYEDSGQGVIHIPLQLDILHLSRNHPSLCSLLFYSYLGFLKIINQAVFEVAEEEISRCGNQYLRDKMRQLSQEDFNCVLEINECLIGRKDIASVEFLNQRSGSKEGTLVYLADCMVVETLPKEVYLYAWGEVWEGCLCEGKSKYFKKSQSFVEVLSTGHLKERSKPSFEICHVCDKVFEICRVMDQTYLNCQKVKFYWPGSQSSSSQQLSSNFLTVYLNFDRVNKMKAGNRMDLCCYFDTQQKYKIFGQKTKIKAEETNLLMCVTAYPSKSIFQYKFLNKIQHISITYDNCKPNEYLKLYSNYKQVTTAINQIQFPFCDANTFTLLKLSLLASVFLGSPLARQYSDQPETLSLLILTDQEQLVYGILQVEGLKYKHFPANYDHSSALLFLSSCRDSIVIFTNPTKKQYPYIQQAIRGEIDHPVKLPLSITVWVILNPTTKPKEFPLEQFDLIVDITFLSNPNDRQVSHDFQGVVEAMMERYLPKEIVGYTTVKNKRAGVDLEQTMVRRDKSKSGKREAHDGMEFLREYYSSAREHKKTNLSGLMSLRKVAIGVASMRRFFLKQKTPMSIDFTDALVSIFLDEETSRNKGGNSNTMLANEIAKFLLHEKEEMTIYEFAFAEGDFEEVRKKVHKSAVFIKIVDEIRRIVAGKSIA